MLRQHKNYIAGSIRHISLPAFILGAVLLSLIACAVNPVTQQRELMLISESQEVGIGQKTDKQVLNTYGLYSERDLNLYVEEIGQRLARVSHRPGLDYHFKILDTPVVNAFAVPGGYVYLTRGILSYLNSEAELAGVLCHEIGHITARHSAKQLSRAQLAQFGMAVGGILLPELQEASELVQMGVGMLFLKFSRDNERQADALGVEYSSRAGYDATQMAGFFETLQRLNPEADKSGLPAWFSTHPNPPDRILNVQELSGRWKSRLGGSHKIGREQYLRKIDGLVYGEDPGHGYVEDNVFYHPELGFKFPVPPKWVLTNAPREVKLRHPGGNALISLTLKQGGNPEQIAGRLIRETGAKVLESGTVRTGGLPAYRIKADIGQTRDVIRLVSYFIQKEDYVYVFFGMCPYKQFRSYSQVIEATLRGFESLKGVSGLRVKPSRLRIRTVKQPGRLKKVLQRWGMPEDDCEKVAVLNGMNLSFFLREGSLLKLIERP